MNSAGGAAGGDDGWGDAATGWDTLSFEAVLSGQAGEHDRSRLVSDLVGTLFTSFADLANTQSGGYIELDEGLRVLTRHAKALGYGAVILFLDELILWLASRLSDRSFINSEIQKVVKPSLRDRRSNNIISCSTKFTEIDMAATTRSLAVKIVGSNGQISLGKQYAGRQVLVEEQEPGVWLVRTAVVVPDNERWLHEPRAAADLESALEWASRNAPTDADLDNSLERLASGES